MRSLLPPVLVGWLAGSGVVKVSAAKAGPPCSAMTTNAADAMDATEETTEARLNIYMKRSLMCLR
jgi:hypothetical protein